MPGAGAAPPNEGAGPGAAPNAGAWAAAAANADGAAANTDGAAPNAGAEVAPNAELPPGCPNAPNAGAAAAGAGPNEGACFDGANGGGAPGGAGAAPLNNPVPPKENPAPPAAGVKRAPCWLAANGVNGVVDAPGSPKGVEKIPAPPPSIGVEKIPAPPGRNGVCAFISWAQFSKRLRRREALVCAPGITDASGTRDYRCKRESPELLYVTLHL